MKIRISTFSEPTGFLKFRIQKKTLSLKLWKFELGSQTFFQFNIKVLPCFLTHAFLLFQHTRTPPQCTNNNYGNIRNINIDRVFITWDKKVIFSLRFFSPFLIFNLTRSAAGCQSRHLCCAIKIERWETIIFYQLYLILQKRRRWRVKEKFINFSQIYSHFWSIWSENNFQLSKW